MKRKVIVISLLAIIASLSIATVSNAAIQIKPTSGDVHIEITASNAYQYCYDMRNASSSLGVNNLDPHLTLNKDWGAAAYLAISAYGTVRSSTGEYATINNYGYKSTTGNVTGIMNMGNKYVYTASIGEGEGDFTYLSNIINNKDTKYVEIIPINNWVNNTKGYAMKETSGWYANSITTPSAGKIYKRRGFLGTDIGAGGISSDVTFRPVIWNK